ncbi:MAG: methyltransferase domain-containing protein [Vicinamibacterales bacterium]
MRVPPSVLTTIALAALLSISLAGQQKPEPAEPVLGQKGKDVQWVPSPAPLVEKMLDMAQVTPKDYLVDLGSGDGVTVIAAARRGVRAMGIEYDANLVEVSKRNATAAGVAHLVTFVRGDIFKKDFSKATVVTTFLLPSLNLQLRPTLLRMKPGTRVVSNTFPMGEWEPDDRVRLDGPCERWCEALFWVVPARVGGCVAYAARRADADAAVPVRQRHARQDSHRRGTAPRHDAHVHRRRREVHRTGRRLPHHRHLRRERPHRYLERCPSLTPRVRETGGPIQFCPLEPLMRGRDDSGP